MKHRAHQLTLRFLSKEWDQADEHERRIMLAIAEKLGTHRGSGREDSRTPGERLADKVAGFGGSWPFSLQAPVILMSQNRQAVRDRQRAGEDYEINLKAELEIKALHDKIDDLTRRIESR